MSTSAAKDLKLADKQGTRQRLVSTARELFYSQGYHATGVQQILRAAEVNSGSLYHFFGGKEDLLLAVLDEYVEARRENRRRTRGRSDAKDGT